MEWLKKYDNYYFVLGRTLLGLYFIVPGMTKVAGYQGYLDLMASKGVPLVEILLPLTILIQVGAGLFLIAGIDVPAQIMQRAKRLGMTKQEVKDEHKQVDGNQQVKGEQRRRRRQMLMETLNTEVPQADVIVTNPTHLAIALKYDREAMGAPRVVAKGARYNALRIREIARKHEIPMVENKPVARLLFKMILRLSSTHDGDLGEGRRLSRSRVISMIRCHVAGWVGR